MNRLNKKGFTIVELLVVVAIIALLISILLPAIGRARDAALVTQSLGNLRNLGAACAAYGADYNDRQFTAVPDEIGMYGNYCVDACNQMSQTQCIPQMLLGWDANGGLWGYWLKGTPERCRTWPRTCGENFVTYQACDYWGTCGSSSSGQTRFLGSWRLTNCKAFNSYVNGRYYDKTFWAPKDTFTLSLVEEYFSSPSEFSVNTNADYAEPTYCWSPAAMWSPDVLAWTRRSGTGAAACVGVAPTRTTMPGAYKSPTSSAAQYPSLKWRMWEHQWLQNREGGETNQVFSDPTPWFYNQGYNSAPAVMCFDGHTQIVSITGIQQDNDLASSQGQPLWFNCGGGINAYYANASYDNLTKGLGAVTAGILTTDGVLGRDMLRIGD
jgi:prepilin-type N-terminal cleavage/methylation domain-containing protein